MSLLELQHSIQELFSAHKSSETRLIITIQELRVKLQEVEPDLVSMLQMVADFNSVTRRPVFALEAE